VIELECGITVYPARQEGDRWRAVWYENGEPRQCEAVAEEKVAAKLAKVTERLTADAPNMERPGADLIAYGLVSNAGLLRSGPILRLDDDDLGLLFDVHVTAAFRLLRVIGGYWRAEAKAGRAIDAAVVLTTSAAGLYGFRAEAAYSAAKAAVAMLARVGADELGRYGTTVNAIAPEARTRLTEWLGEPTADPAGDPLAAEHVAPVVAWLLGPGARDVTGRVLETGNGQISVPGTWQPGTPFPLPPLMPPEAADALLPRMLASATPPPALLTSLQDPGRAAQVLPADPGHHPSTAEERGPTLDSVRQS